MTTAPSRHHRLATLAGLSVTLITTSLLPATARAAGFSGSFDPANWSIVNTTAGAIDQTLSGSDIPPAYTCGSTNANDVACAEQVDASTGSVDVVGSVSGFNGGGTANTIRTTTWTVTNGAQSSVLSFSWALATLASPTAGNQSVSYLIGAIETPISSTAGDAGSLTNITVGASETFGFRVTTADNISDYGVLSISGFDAVNSPASVPSPLPLAGGIAAFSWSRRLRSRIRLRNS
jgi:hypothetical protein